MKTRLLAFFVLCLTLSSFNNTPIRINLAGDSTMADKPLTKEGTDALSGEAFVEDFLERGWGQLLKENVKDNVLVNNYAKNGRSTRTFIEEGLWDKLIENTHKGDFVIIQFGHNDGAEHKLDRYTNPTQFRLNFTAFIAEVRAKGANPILCTPVARRKFDEKGNLVATHGEYPDIIRSVAKEENVPLIDMEEATSKWLQDEGVENSKKYFHKFEPGVSKLYPDGLDDNTHFNEMGARVVANLFIDEIKKQNNKDLINLMIKQHN